MDDAYSVDAMQDKAFNRADVGKIESVMVTRIGVGDAGAAGRDTLEAIVEHRLEIDGQRSRLGRLLGVVSTSR